MHGGIKRHKMGPMAVAIGLGKNGNFGGFHL
jgi:hypothetical protein